MAACAKLDPSINSKFSISCARLDHAFYLNKCGKRFWDKLLKCFFVMQSVRLELSVTYVLVATSIVAILQAIDGKSSGEKIFY